MNLLEHTNRVSFELSNRCNYASVHKGCPLYLQKDKEPVILSTEVIENTLSSLKWSGFRNTIAFHVYNEPLLDPRLIWLMKSHSYFQFFILTNGHYLTQSLAKDLQYAGAIKLIASAYSDEEEYRLNKLSLTIPYEVIRRSLDDRLDVYDRPKVYGKACCFAPLNEIVINCKGQVQLCCLDWKGKYTFGDLNKESLEDVLKKGDMQKIYNDLSSGRRLLTMCERCKTSR